MGTTIPIFTFPFKKPFHELVSFKPAAAAMHGRQRCIGNTAIAEPATPPRRSYGALVQVALAPLLSLRIVAARCPSAR